MELYARLLQQEGKTEEAKKIRGEAADIRDSLAMSKRQPSGPDVHRIGGDVRTPVLVSKVEPEYTEEARIAKYDGTVLLFVEIGADGIVGNINVVRGLGLGLDQKAVKAVSQWRFLPGTENGQAVKVAAQIEVNFRLL